MKEVKLFDHNERAYKKLKESLERNKCTTINHATGTGKSFIALKYLFENRDKKYLYLAPSYPIIEQLKADCYKVGLIPEDLNIDTMIYVNLLKQDMKEIYQKYDGIIFDEYHRTGADETYKKIKELKLYLQEGNDQKKFIGLTATPIRYLDDERNMTEEIFDGNVSSKISLSEAMLEGLLPVPLYINSKIACRDKLSKFIKKIQKLPETREKRTLEGKIEKISKKIDNGSLDTKKMIDQYVTEKNGKYIIFCDTISSLERTYKEVDKWFSKFGKIKKYKVYSNQADEENHEEGEKKRNSRAVNQSNLDKFNNEKDGISVLLCVDILNEGVHVDGIDGVFLQRRTVSPIIYFQQIGRALSFSGRKKQIKIFDMVNNFGNHNSIDSVYIEFKEEMQRMIKEHPEKAEQYKAILDRFKIMDETKEILKELDEVREELTPKKIIMAKLDYSLELLKNKIASEGEFYYIYGDENAKKAYSTIAKYYKYVDNDQFKQILELGILLPEELSMTYEERINQLEGYNSIIEREEAEYDLCVESFIKFINRNNRKPEEKAVDEEEKLLKQKYLMYIADLNKKQLEKISICMDEKNIEYDSWEKVLLDKKISLKDVNDIINISNKYISKNQVLPDFIQDAIIKITLRYDIRQNMELFSILEKSEGIEQEYREQKEQIRREKLSKIVNFLRDNGELNETELGKKGIIDEIKKLKPADRDYIRRKYYFVKKKHYQEILNEKEKNDMQAFCRHMKGLKGDELENLFSDVKQDYEKYATLNEIMDFMMKHKGKLPKENSIDELENELANRLDMYIKYGAISQDFSNIEDDIQSVWYSPEKIMYDIITENFGKCDTKMTILKNIDFFNKNGHRALKNSSDEAERKIAIEYEQKCIDRMDLEQITILTRIFNGNNGLRRTCEAYVRNKRAEEEKRKAQQESNNNQKEQTADGKGERD